MAEESTLERFSVTLAKALGIWTRKFTSPGHAGVPDRIFASNGNVLFVEFKAKGEQPDPLQQYEIKQLLKQGCKVACVDNKDTIEVLLRLLEADVEQCEGYLSKVNDNNPSAPK